MNSPTLSACDTHRERPLRILLMGDFSNVHWSLAEGLRELGHEVTVASDGDSWKGYQRDINLRRRSLGKLDSLLYYRDCRRVIRHLSGYDVVQLINPVFLSLRGPRILPFYERLRRQNGKLFLGAFGMDHYWVKTCLDCKTFRYSDFNIGDRPRTEESYNKPFIRDWLQGEKSGINIHIANDCDGIVTGLYEYDRCYRPYFPEKTQFIPFPINLKTVTPKAPRKAGDPVRFFVGVQKERNEYKGTDVMLRALRRVESRHPGKCEVRVVESVPFKEYQRLMDSSDVILDQLYSYTPAMNALLAMSKGLIVVGGGEPENYEILGEQELRPIVNVLPDEEDVFHKLENLVLHPECIPQLSRESVEYVRRHHDHIHVALQYLEFWQAQRRNTLHDKTT